jgi:hypothetical protein
VNLALGPWPGADSERGCWSAAMRRQSIRNFAKLGLDDEMPHAMRILSWSGTRYVAHSGPQSMSKRVTTLASLYAHLPGHSGTVVGLTSDVWDSGSARDRWDTPSDS